MSQAELAKRAPYPIAPLALWVVPCALVLLALGPWPYGYYTFMRLVVCGCAATLAYLFYRSSRQIQAWAFGLTALLYNPVAKVSMERETWMLFNLVTAALFAWSVARRPLQPTA